MNSMKNPPSKALEYFNELAVQIFISEIVKYQKF